MKLKRDEDAWNDYLYWQTQDKKTLKRINSLLNDIMLSPFEGIGKPEPLRHCKGYRSRRTDETNRIVYKADNGTVNTYKKGSDMYEPCSWSGDTAAYPLDTRCI